MNEPILASGTSWKLEADVYDSCKKLRLSRRNGASLVPGAPMSTHPGLGHAANMLNHHQIWILKSYLKVVAKHCVIWTIALTFFSFLRDAGREHLVSSGQLDIYLLRGALPFRLVVGCIAGFLFGSYDFFMRRYVEKRFSFGATTLIVTLGYALVVSTLLLTVFSVVILVAPERVNWGDFARFVQDGEAGVLVAYCFVVGFAIDFVYQVDKKFGPGNLKKMLLGEFYHPKQEERIFMFLDMRSSTSIAEKLGHIRYSKLVQDCFRDIDIVSRYKAEIYQYVGDEAVLTWNRAEGLDERNCLEAFFAFTERLQNRGEYYKERYGMVPEFKAGLNLGEVTVAEVGEIKREIAYHGDILHTAARIQSKCNEFKKNLLVSDQLYQALGDGETLQLSRGRRLIPAEEGEVVLRGKAASIRIYSLVIDDLSSRAPCNTN